MKDATKTAICLMIIFAEICIYAAATHLFFK